MVAKVDAGGETMQGVDDRKLVCGRVGKRGGSRHRVFVIPRELFKIGVDAFNQTVGVDREFKNADFMANKNRCPTTISLPKS
ncbi:hypothetical protein D3C77_675640 [compost metagenome]